MSCKEVEGRILTDYLDGLLTGEEKESLEMHLRGCAACRELLATAQATLAPLRGAARLEPPAHLWKSISEQIRAERRSSTERPKDLVAWLRTWVTRPAPILATAAVVFLLLATTLLSRHGAQEMSVTFDAGAQIDYMAALLDSEGTNPNGDTEGFNTVIEEYFL